MPAQDATTRRDLTSALDALRNELNTRAGALAGEIRDGFSTAARVADVARVEQLTAQTMERLRARIGELERMEQLTRDRLERLHAELETVRGELGEKTVALRQELEQGLGERVRAGELEQMEQLTRDRLERLHAELETVRGELGGKIGLHVRVQAKKLPALG